MDPDDINYQHDNLKDHDTTKLKETVRLITDILEEKGRVSNYDFINEHNLIQKLEDRGITWSHHNIRNNILPDIRNTLNEQELITVEKVAAEKGGLKKKLWVLPEGDNQ